MAFLAILGALTEVSKYPTNTHVQQFNAILQKLRKYYAPKSY